MLSGFETSNNQYSLACNARLEFEVNEREKCYNYNITDDEDCELGVSRKTLFKVQLALTTTNDQTILLTTGRELAKVFIDDSAEPECCKLKMFIH